MSAYKRLPPVPRWLLGVLVLLSLISITVPAKASHSPRYAVHQIHWEDFAQESCHEHDDQILCGIQDDPLPDGDVIWLKRETSGVPLNQVELVLQTGRHVTWWKEIKVFDRYGHELSWVSTQNANHGPVVMRLNTSQLYAASIVFSKAKAFGIHTGMYEVFGGLYNRGGTRFIFTWETDG
jgi:hypothetical protein